jgi:hypothetical protein
MATVPIGELTGAGQDGSATHVVPFPPRLHLLGAFPDREESAKPVDLDQFLGGISLMFR